MSRSRRTVTEEERALFKAVRYEGLYEHGAAFITDINCSDEDAYVKALDGLKSIFVYPAVVFIPLFISK